VRLELDAVFLDRDGVFNVDRPDCVRSWEEFELIPGSVAAAARLSRAGLPVYLVTNQSCVGRGWVARGDLDSMHERLAGLIAEAGGVLDGLYICPHAPGAGCACRKPAPGLLLAAIAEHDLAPGRCVFVGDSSTDLKAALSAAVPSLLVRSGKGERTAAALPEGVSPIHIAADLAAAADWLLS